MSSLYFLLKINKKMGKKTTQKNKKEKKTQHKTDDGFCFFDFFFFFPTARRWDALSTEDFCPFAFPAAHNLQPARGSPDVGLHVPDAEAVTQLTLTLAGRGASQPRGSSGAVRRLLEQLGEWLDGLVGWRQVPPGSRASEPQETCTAPNPLR